MPVSSSTCSNLGAVSSVPSRSHFIMVNMSMMTALVQHMDRAPHLIKVNSYVVAVATASNLVVDQILQNGFILAAPHLVKGLREEGLLS